MADKEKKIEDVFSKEQILQSKKYLDRRDLLSVLLTDQESYSFKAVDDIIKKFMEGEVN